MNGDIKDRLHRLGKNLNQLLFELELRGFYLNHKRLSNCIHGLIENNQSKLILEKADEIVSEWENADIKK